jgi:hypothetical protein
MYLCPPGGGVVEIICDMVEYSVCKERGAPDLAVLNFEGFFLIGAYLLPAGSYWREWSEIDLEI